MRSFSSSGQGVDDPDTSASGSSGSTFIISSCSGVVNVLSAVSDDPFSEFGGQSADVFPKNRLARMIYEMSGKLPGSVALSDLLLIGIRTVTAGTFLFILFGM